ncbi:hypothetical protein [Paenibacillus sp. Mc5Re-14]|uniref:hypothetical protein n=1 Tax=Paenibacillus sp. Mc5Re-14 TaxID=1030529 RepID=UPI000AAA76B3|nr:hypothetical protein [Paenibacillus sp. Mc5Re-14]
MEIQNGKFSLIEADLTKEDFKREWSHIEQAGVYALLDEFLSEFYDEQMNANSFFGLAWTSSGRFSELGVQSPDITIDGNELNAFLIRNNNQLIAHCFDEDENDLFYEVQ